MSDKVAAFELPQLGDGSEQIVVSDDEDFVGRTLGAVEGGQKNARCVVAFAGFAATQVFKAQKSFELVVEGGDFRGSHSGRKRQDQPVALDRGRGEGGISGSLQVERPEAIVGVGAGSEGRKSGHQAKEVSDELSEEFPDRHGSRHGSRLLSWWTACLFPFQGLPLHPMHPGCRRTAQARGHAKYLKKKSLCQTRPKTAGLGSVYGRVQRTTI